MKQKPSHTPGGANDPESLRLQETALGLADTLEALLPSDTTFALIVFKRGPTGHFAYVAKTHPRATLDAIRRIVPDLQRAAARGDVEDSDGGHAHEWEPLSENTTRVVYKCRLCPATHAEPKGNA